MSSNTDFRSLRYFVKAAEHEHLGRAAEALGVAKSTLSRQIAQLEQRTRTALFERTASRVILTPAGRVVLTEARKALAQGDYTLRLGQRSSAVERRALQVGYVDSAVYNAVTAEILSRLRRGAAGVTLEMRPMNVVQQIEAVAGGSLDFGFVRGPLPLLGRNLRTHRVISEPLVVAVPSDHPLAGSAEIPACALAREPIVCALDPSGVGLEGQISQIAQAAGFAADIVQHAPRTTLMVSLIAAGFGIAIVPASLTHSGMTGIAIRPLAGAHRSELFVLWRRNEHRRYLTDVIASDASAASG